MVFSRVHLIFVTVLATLAFGGCESTSSSQSGGKIVGTKLKSKSSLEALLETMEVKATNLELGRDGSVLIPNFDLDTAIFVVDTSGSMRDGRTGLMRTDVVARVGAFMMSMEGASRFDMFDGSGRPIGRPDRDELAAELVFSAEEHAVHLLRFLRLYPYESESNWLSGLKRALRSAQKNGEESRTQIFVFGDEYTGNSLAELEGIQKEGRAIPVNVIRAHEGLIYGSSIFTTSKKFELFGSRIAELTGGRYFQFVPPEFRQTAEAMLLGRLAIEHPGETWYIDAEMERVAKLNKWLQEEFRTGRLFLVAGTEETALDDPKGIFVSIDLPNRKSGVGVSYVQYRSTDGSQDLEYKVSLRRLGESLDIAEWELHWDLR